MTARPHRCRAALVLALLAVPAAAASPARPTAAEQKGIDALVARILEREVRLAPARTAGGGRQVVLELRRYGKALAEDGSVRIEESWDRSWGEGLRSLDDLTVAVEIAEHFCGGEGRIYLVTLTSKRNPAAPRHYGTLGPEELKRREYMAAEACTE